MDCSVTPTIAKCVPPKMRRSKRLETRRSALIPRTIQENHLETVNSNLSQIVLINKCSDNSKKECNSVQKSLKKITHEKECDIQTDHQCNVENVWQCRQVLNKCAILSLKEWASLRVSKDVKLSESAPLQRRLENATL